MIIQNFVIKNNANFVLKGEKEYLILEVLKFCYDDNCFLSINRSSLKYDSFKIKNE
jgi:hypothetical protein